MFCRVTPLVSGLSRAPNLLWNCGNCPGVRQVQHDISLIVLHRDFATAAATTPQKPPSTARPLRRIRGVEPTNAAEYFEDWKEIVVTGGSGGNGICSFLSLPYTEYAGPDGGDGGNGGHVIFEATHNFNSLNHVSAKITGQSGTKGRSKDMHGKSAPPTVIQVPLGTLFRDQNDQLVKELKRKGERFVAARGGAGGRGNAFFKSNDLRAPMVRENGGLGETKTYAVELRVMAHVGLVGFPNAGKSSLLRAISRARPKVASYPFTTLQPYVGYVEYEDYVQIAVADIPGLVPDAHKNRGLGVDFLRHIERCVCLLYVIDLSKPEPWLQLEHLRYELDMYRPGLADRPCAIVGNKIDLPEAVANLPAFEAEVKMPVFPVSAMKGMNITALLMHIRKLYDEHPEETPPPDEDDEE